MIEGAALCVEDITAEGERIVMLSEDIDLYSGGSMPLPPYIRRESDAEDAARYQTVFAHTPGALAAPTAGLHFTPEILSQIPHTFVTLHVGTGTFLPVRSENIAEHRMHAERFSILASAAGRINDAERIAAVEHNRRTRFGIRQARKWKAHRSGRFEQTFSFTRHIDFEPSTFC